MTFALYDATVPTYRQILTSVLHLLGKAEAWCAEGRATEQEIIDARFAPDMLPFSYQVKSAAMHSVHALRSALVGQYEPDRSPAPESFSGMKARIAEALEVLAAFKPDEINAVADRDMCIVLREKRLDFTSTSGFLMSFSMPNFLFHSSTAYGLLRMKGLEIGKMDFLGAIALKV
jgi:hypothetical protein